MMVATSREVLLSLVVEGGGSCVREEEQVRAHTSYIEEEEEEEEEIHALLLETFTSVGSSPGAGETSREGIRNESGSNRELRDYFRMNRLCLRRLLRRLEISAHQEKKKKRGPSPKVLGRTTDRYIITHCQPWFRHGTFVKSFVCFFFSPLLFGAPLFFFTNKWSRTKKTLPCREWPANSRIISAKSRVGIGAKANQPTWFGTCSLGIMDPTLLMFFPPSFSTLKKQNPRNSLVECETMQQQQRNIQLWSFD